MIKSNTAFLQVLADRARAASGDDSFHRLADVSPVPGWVDGVDDGVLVVAGQGLRPAYCLTGEAVWQRFVAVSAKRLFAFDEVVSVRDLARAHAGDGADVAPARFVDVEVRLLDGRVVALETAGRWLAMFLERCARYRAERTGRQPSMSHQELL